MIEFGSRVRLDYQPLFGKMSPHSSPPPLPPISLRGGSKTVPTLGRNGHKERAREEDTQGERERLPERPMKIIFTGFLRVWKVSIG